MQQKWCGMRGASTYHEVLFLETFAHFLDELVDQIIVGRDWECKDLCDSVDGLGLRSGGRHVGMGVAG